MHEAAINPVLAEALGAHPATGTHVTVQRLIKSGNNVDWMVLMAFDNWVNAEENIKDVADKLAKAAAKVAATGRTSGVAISQYAAEYEAAVGARDALRPMMSAAVVTFKKEHGWND